MPHLLGRRRTTAALCALEDHGSCFIAADTYRHKLTSGSEAVLETIGEIARAEGASVHLLSVHAPVHEVEVQRRIVSYSDQETERVEAETRTCFQRVAASLGPVTVSFAVRFGEPVAQIVEEAAAVRATLIAMATHRRIGIARIFKGSVAERVERGTTIPVMLVQYGTGSSLRHRARRTGPYFSRSSRRPSLTGPSQSFPR